jgi:hypothetical protein
MDRGDAVKGSAHPSTQHYAVISVGTRPHCERLVIQYSDEESLRDLIAAPSIVALGYGSREQAVARMNGCTPSSPTWRQQLRTALVDVFARFIEFRASRLQAVRRIDAVRTGKIVSALCRHSLAVTVVFLYSKNVLSAAVRAMISF